MPTASSVSTLYLGPKLGALKIALARVVFWGLGSWKINGFWMRLTVLQLLSFRPIFLELEPFEGPPSAVSVPCFWMCLDVCGQH